MAAPQRGTCASSGRAWRLWAARHAQGERRAYWAPRPTASVLEPAACKAVDLDFTGCDCPGMHFSISVKNINAQAAAGLTSASSSAAASAVALAELVSAQEVARVFGVGVGVGVGVGGL